MFRAGLLTRPASPQPGGSGSGSAGPGSFGISFGIFVKFTYSECNYNLLTTGLLLLTIFKILTVQSLTIMSVLHSDNNRKSKKVLKNLKKFFIRPGGWGCPSAPPSYIPNEIKSFKTSINILNIASVIKHQNNNSKNNSCSKGPGYKPAKI